MTSKEELELKAEREVLRDENKKLTEKCNHLLIENMSLQAKNAELEKQCVGFSALRERRARIEGQLQALQRAAANHEERVGGLKLTIDHLQAEKRRVEEDRDTLREELSSLRLDVQNAVTALEILTRKNGK